MNYWYHCLFKTLEGNQYHLSEVEEFFASDCYTAGVLEVRLATSIKHARHWTDTMWNLVVNQNTLNGVQIQMSRTMARVI